MWAPAGTGGGGVWGGRKGAAVVGTVKGGGVAAPGPLPARSTGGNTHSRGSAACACYTREQSRS